MLLLVDRQTHSQQTQPRLQEQQRVGSPRCPVRPSLPALPTAAWGRGSVSATKSAPGGAPQSSHRAPRPRFAVGSRPPGEGRRTVSPRARLPETSLLLPPRTQHGPAPAGRNATLAPDLPALLLGREPPAATRPGRLGEPDAPPRPHICNTHAHHRHDARPANGASGFVYPQLNDD